MVRVTPTPYIWMDGGYVSWEEARVHVLTPTLHYGWGVFEGMRAHPSPHGPRIFRLDAHLDRLFRSAARCGIEIPHSREALAEGICGVAAHSGLDGCYIRPVIYAESGEMGIDPTFVPMRSFIAAWHWADSAANGSLDTGISACISARRRDLGAAVPAGVKACGSYLNAVMARAEAVRSGYAEAILLNAAGNVSDACVANVFAVYGEEIVTPSLEDGPLGGITRDTVLQLADFHGLSCAERTLTAGDLHAADEIFLTGTAAGLVPVVALDNRRVAGQPGAVTLQLAAAYRNLTATRDPGFADWFTETATLSGSTS